MITSFRNGESIEVSAGCCLWFLWADGVKPGPGGENVKAHRPVKVLVPENARGKKAEISCTGGNWRFAKENDHSFATADGRPPARRTEAYYHSAEYTSEHIEGIEANRRQRIFFSFVCLSDRRGDSCTTEEAAILGLSYGVQVAST